MPQPSKKIICAWMTLVLIAALSTTLMAQANPPVPTMDDLHAMYDAKSYRVCLQQIYRVLNLRPDLAVGYDRGVLLLLRGNCLVQLRDLPTALMAFKGAEEAGTGDVKVQAHAMRVLLAASPGLVFRPIAVNAGGPFDITDPDACKKAMMALFNDRYDAAARLVANVQNATTLVQMKPMLSQVLDLAALEKVATGSIDRALPLGRSIGDKARDLINSELGVVTTRDNNIRQLANTLVYTGTIVPNGTQWWGGTERRGLTVDDRNTLRADFDYLTQIQDTITMAAELAQTYAGAADRWVPIANSTAQALDLANSTLNAE